MLRTCSLSLCCSLLGLTVGLAGCSQPVAEFTVSDGVHGLIPAAEKAVTKTLVESFGTPNDLVAWERFPVQYHAARGTVVSTAAGVELKLDQPFGHLPAVKPGVAYMPLMGAKAGQSSGVLGEIDLATGTAALPSGGVAEGDVVAAGHGEFLSFGRAVYMKNCMHCHGTTGDGKGPTAEYLNPRPRDYRLGIFKFTSTHSSEKVSRDDLKRIVLNGIPGTYMPSFLLIGEKESEAVVEYVRWLAMRGEFEKRVTDELADFSKAGAEDSAKKAQLAYEAAVKAKESATRPKSASALQQEAASEFAKYIESDYGSMIDETANFLAASWTRSDEAESVVIPKQGRVPDSAESRMRGRKLYLSDKTKCYTCHGEAGRGDGYAAEDFWKKPGSNDFFEKRGLHDTWGNPLKPRNLTLGQYRGGRRPIDLYRRMYAGIKGTPMPAFGGTVLSDQDIWDLVNYVTSLQFDSQKSPSPKSLATAGH